MILVKFEELDIKSTYDSRRVSVYDEFFNKILPNCKYYRRFGGFFTAYRFALMAEGLQDFIKENNGMMELLIIPVFNDEDKQTLLKGISVDDVITKKWIDDLSKIKEKFVEDHKMALSWMIANEFLTIKLILPQHDDGTPLTINELKEHTILHREIGIFYNSEDQSPLSFHGFIDRNNSETGELYSLDVSRNWIDSETERIDKDHHDFSTFWDYDSGEFGDIKFQVRPLSPKLDEYFKKTAPKSKDELPEIRKPPVLRPYQKTAILEWEKNAYRGIFEMATGTGKTFTGIGCIKRVEAKEPKLLVIITVPYRNLVDQWKSELAKWFISSTTLDDGSWRQILRDEVQYLNSTTKQTISVLIVSHNLFKTKDFVKQIELTKIPSMLIVDEAHHVGTYSSREGLSPKYDYRLALSATIDRYFDDDGTQFLRDYFGTDRVSTVCELSLKRAIDEGKLCKYYYHPSFIELTDEELLEYRDLTHKAAKLLNSDDPEDKKHGENLLEKRARIIRDAENKFPEFQKVIKKMPHLNRLLIFCSENQFDWVDDVLNNLSRYCGINSSPLFRKITYDNPSNKKDRTKILQDFAKEEWDALLSNRVLDEGMDIPQAQNCIVLASTGNPTQFIQRRGRVLRIYDDYYKDGTKKEFACIYDVLVKPQINSLDNPDAIKLEISMIRSQLNRIKSMSLLAINRDDCMKKINEFTYGLPPESFDIDK